MKPPAMNQTASPDYAGLVKLLPTLRRLADAAGVVSLEPDEVERVRSLGFHAQTGFWQVPPLPACLVAGNPLLEALSDDTDPFWRRRQSTPEPGYQAAGIIEHPIEPVGRVEDAAIQNQPKELSPPAVSETDCAAILTAVERSGGTIERRGLQKKLWRMKAAQFNQAVASLVEHGLIRFEGKMIAASPRQCPEKEL